MRSGIHECTREFGFEVAFNHDVFRQSEWAANRDLDVSLVDDLECCRNACIVFALELGGIELAQIILSSTVRVRDFNHRVRELRDVRERSELLEVAIPKRERSSCFSIGCDGAAL